MIKLLIWEKIPLFLTPTKVLRDRGELILLEHSIFLNTLELEINLTKEQIYYSRDDNTD